MILVLFNADERVGTDELVEVISEAIRGWLVGVRDSVDSVVAAGGMDLGLEVYRVIAPALGAEFIATAASDAPITGVERLDLSLSWPDGVDGPATVEELLAEYPGTFAGVDPSQVSFVVASPVWRGEFDRYLKTAVNLVVGMEDTTFRKMSSLLSDVKLGGRFEQLEAVRAFLSWEAEGGYEGWMRRAERIARTELQVARSHAVFTSARMLADAGVRVEKMWNAAHDERTREWHAAADGQIRDVNDPFDVGGEPLMFPGDREHGSAENVIQCRCVVSYVPAEDEVDLKEVAGVTSLEDVNRMIEETVMSDSMVASGVKGLSWKGVLAPLGEATGDGRVFEEDGAFRFRQFPLPLLWQESTGEGHDTSRVVGTIEGGEVQDGRITAWGTVFEDEEKLVALLEKGVVRPSVDLCDMEAEVREGEEGEKLHVLSATVMAATLVATPAFENVGIELSGGVVDVEPGGLVASAGVEFEEYNAGAFGDPELDGPTPLTVTDAGLVFGHLALWDTCHVGQPRRCVTPPKSESGYAAFHQSTIRTEKGMLAVGRLTVGGGHADTRAGVRAAAEHYDQTGSCWAFVRAGEDEFGVWVAGQVNEDCDPARVREGASAPLSGDWRRVGGAMELVAALSVSTPGFPVRREFSEGGVGMCLVAAAGVPAESVEPEVEQEVGTSVSSGTYAETMRALREFFGDDSDGVDDSLAGRWEAARSVFAKDSLEAAAVVFEDDEDGEGVE